MDKRNVTITSELKEVRRVDDMIKTMCTDYSDFADESDVIRLSVTEAVTNVIEHGYSMQPGLQIDVTVEIEDDAMSIAISDTGAPIPAGRLDEVRQPPIDASDLDNLPEGGWGLFICKTQMDGVDYDSNDGVNTLVLKKRAVTV